MSRLPSVGEIGRAEAAGSAEEICCDGEVLERGRPQWSFDFDPEVVAG